MMAMQTLRDQYARQAWSEVRTRVSMLQGAPPAPTMGEVFREGFLRGSMLQMAVCTPGRRAATTKVSRILVTRLGSKATKSVVA